MAGRSSFVLVVSAVERDRERVTGALRAEGFDAAPCASLLEAMPHVRRGSGLVLYDPLSERGVDLAARRRFGALDVVLWSDLFAGEVNQRLAVERDGYADVWGRSLSNEDLVARVLLRQGKPASAAAPALAQSNVAPQASAAQVVERDGADGAALSGEATPRETVPPDAVSTRSADVTPQQSEAVALQSSLLEDMAVDVEGFFAAADSIFSERAPTEASHEDVRSAPTSPREDTTAPRDIPPTAPARARRSDPAREARISAFFEAVPAAPGSGAAHESVDLQERDEAPTGPQVTVIAPAPPAPPVAAASAPRTALGLAAPGATPVHPQRAVDAVTTERPVARGAASGPSAKVPAHGAAVHVPRWFDAAQVGSEGSFLDHHLLAILGSIASQRFSGALEIVGAEGACVVACHAGKLLCAEVTEPSLDLAAYLLASGLVDERTAQLVRESAEAEGVTQGEVLIRAGALTVAALAEAGRAHLRWLLGEVHAWRASYRLAAEATAPGEGVDAATLVLELSMERVSDAVGRAAMRSAQGAPMVLIAERSPTWPARGALAAQWADWRGRGSFVPDPAEGEQVRLALALLAGGYAAFQESPAAQGG